MNTDGGNFSRRKIRVFHADHWHPRYSWNGCLRFTLSRL